MNLDVAGIMRFYSKLSREMPAMLYLEGTASAEIGTRVGKTALAVRVRLHRIRKRLRDLFGPESESGP